MGDISRYIIERKKTKQNNLRRNVFLFRELIIGNRLITDKKNFKGSVCATVKIDCVTQLSISKTGINAPGMIDHNGRSTGNSTM